LVQIATIGLFLGALGALAGLALLGTGMPRKGAPAARRLGPYVLGDRLGAGGMGVVHRATHGALHREVALKLLRTEQLDRAAVLRFEREAVATARLRHPNTVAVYDHGRSEDGIIYYAMEYLDGLHVGDLVAREGPLPPGRVVSLLAQVCASLEEAHALGLVHRDIKPENVMVVGRPGAWDHVKVLDFGLVKNLVPDEGELALTRADRLTGTPLYMAPEAIARPDAAEPRSDLYAVAALGYFMLTGYHVFEGDSLVAICAAHLHEAPVPPSRRAGREMPSDLEALILKGLAKSPDDRPQNARELRETLLRCRVPPWTQDDARAWWRPSGEQAPAAPARSGLVPSLAATVTAARPLAALG
jgi:serine/threonine protein kinase